MAVEIEFKFALMPRHAARVLHHAAVERTAVGPEASGKLSSVYYDTPQFELNSAGIALRLRRTESGWVQTVKWGGAAIGGLYRRNEFEIAVADQTLVLDALTEPEIATVLASARLRKRIRPVFVTDFQRTTRMLAWPAGGSAELSVDRGRIVAGHVQEPICELELELKSGETDTLFALVAELESAFALRPAARSKAERGYMLAGLDMAPVRARPVLLEQNVSIAESAARLIASGLEHLQANEHGVLHSQNPEYLHQMRVAVRRLRSCLGVYAGALPPELIDGLRSELRWFGRRLGPARDWDVFLTETLPPLNAGVRGIEDLSGLEEGAQTLRDAAHRSAQAAVNSRRYARLVLGLGRLASARAWREGEGVDQGPVLPFAARLLDLRLERVLGPGSGRKARSVEELHALRIAVKKLRYAVEFFAGLYPGADVKTFREPLVRLQDCLGVINDASAMQRFVDLAMPSASRLGPIALGWSARTVQDERERLRSLWRAFRRQRKFW